jgi:serine/threonine-protein kinase
VTGITVGRAWAASHGCLRRNTVTAMEFRILGPLEVVGEEGPLRLGGHKPRAVLAHLLVRANRVVPAEVLIDELWGEELPEDARNALQTHVSRLRSVVGEGRIESRSSGYVLLVEAGELDAGRFEALVADARADLAEDPAAAAGLLREALALWRGPALSDLGDEPSLAGEIARLEELRLAAVEDRLSAELALGQHSRLVGELEALAREHPLRERVWGDLMLALYRSGRQADALEAYGRARAVLAEELGIDPSRRLQRLHEQILAQDPTLSVVSRPMPAVRPAAMPGELAPDTQIAGYRIEDLLGRGGMGAVYLAEDLRLRRRIALKILSPELARHPGFRERFVRESQIAAGIEHPGIVPIYEAGEAEDVLYIAMRYVRGTDLGRLLSERGPLEPERAVRIVGQVAEALDAAHAEGLVHRDVKPGNILIVEGAGSQGRDLVYLSDFGLTKRLEGDSGLTKTGQFVGTVDYVAPEQIEGKPVGARTDVYSLGCVLFECLTGRPPHARETEVATLYAHLSDDVPRLEDRRPNLPPALGAALARALSKDPAGRFATCGDLASAATEALAPDVDGARPPRRRRSAAVLSAAAFAVALVTIIAVSIRDSREQPPPASPTQGSSPSPPASPTPAPYFTALDRAPTTEEERLLALVPEAIRGSCDPAEPQAPRVDRDDALGAVACDDGETQALYELFGSRDRMDVSFGNRVNDAGTFGGNCATDHEAQNDYTVGGEDRGRVMCYRDRGRSVLAWTDENLLVLGHAIRDDLGDLSLYDWWLQAGPVDADTPAAKDGPPLAVSFPQGTFLAEVTDEQELRELGVSGQLNATIGIRLADGVYRHTYSGPTYEFRDGTYVLTKGPTVVFTESTSTLGCVGASATYQWTVEPDGSVRWRFVEADSGCRPGPYPTTGEAWVPGPVGEIVFEQYGELVVESVDGLTAAKLTSTPLLDNVSPSWSPDGGHIVFSSNRPDPGSSFDLYLMNSDGSNVVQLTDDPGNEFDPAWSPGGTLIAFHAESTADPDESFSSSLSLIDPDGSGRVDLVTRGDQDVGRPSWSPDGTRIAFRILHDVTTSNSPMTIYVVNADGTGLLELATTSDVVDTAPVWTPDGRRIVFWGDDGEGRGTLLSIRPDGSGLQPFALEFPDTDFLVPSWSPDGRWMALAGTWYAVSPLYLVDVDGGPVYTFGLNASEPKWRPAPS